jgi:hypothetical protein
MQLPRHDLVTPPQDHCRSHVYNAGPPRVSPPILLPSGVRMVVYESDINPETAPVPAKASLKAILCGEA